MKKSKKPESWTLKGRTPPFRRLICYSKRISVVRGADLSEFVSSNFFGKMCVFVHVQSKLVVDFPLETRIPKNMEIVLHCLHVSSFLFMFTQCSSFFFIFLHVSSFSSLFSFFMFLHFSNC